MNWSKEEAKGLYDLEFLLNFLAGVFVEKLTCVCEEGIQFACIRFSVLPRFLVLDVMQI
jgi:hypothetical protein